MIERDTDKTELVFANSAADLPFQNLAEPDCSLHLHSKPSQEIDVLVAPNYLNQAPDPLPPYHPYSVSPWVARADACL